jgi:hypothetical protein
MVVHSRRYEMETKIQVQRGTFANLPTLSVGEPAFCTDTKQFFIGDGTNNIDLSATHVADRYSASKTYAVGEYCIYNNLLFKCTTAITAAEAWNAAKWTLTTVLNEYSILNNIGQPTTKTIIWSSGNTPTAQLCYKVGNLVHIEFKMPSSVGIANATELVGTVPIDCRPVYGTQYSGTGHALRVASATYADSFGILGRVTTLGELLIANDFGIEMFGAAVAIEYTIT